MCETEEGSHPADSDAAENDRLFAAYAQKEKQNRKRGRLLRSIYLFIALLVLDVIATIILTTPVLPNIQDPSTERISSLEPYSLYNTLIDVFILAILRISTALYTLLWNYLQNRLPTPPFLPHHPNGTPKTREELDEEALEEPTLEWMRRNLCRTAGLCELSCTATMVLAICKCLARLNIEIGVYGDDKVPPHPAWWWAICSSCIFSFLEILVVEKVGGDVRTYVCLYKGDDAAGGDDHLTSPLLPPREDDDVETPPAPRPSEDRGQVTGHAVLDPDDSDPIRGTSDITEEAGYRADWKDLIGICRQDLWLILLAFVFLVMAAVAQTFIPKITGNILDLVAVDNSADDDGYYANADIWDMPGFVDNIKLLVLLAIVGGVFSAIRGSIFTVVGARVNVRLRTMMMDSLLTQDVGFYDTTKTGDITSRLTSDTTLVGDQLTLNVNVFLRSLVQAIGVLIFMFMISWQLSMVAFISVPAVSVFSKGYGRYIQSLTKVMQKKLADGNAVSEAVIGTMSTVRAFGAGHNELKEFQTYMDSYLRLNLFSALAYFGYCTAVTALPSIVLALVLFYGGLLVRSQGDDHITSGQLVSFVLYLTSLSSAFNSIADIYTSLTRAVGAADKAFELIYRKPKMRYPSQVANSLTQARRPQGGTNIGNNHSPELEQGLCPDQCFGEVTLNEVHMYYPARPLRKVLHGLSLKAEPGTVVALVGPSGGGKSSIISLIQHLYEPARGQICIDGIEVHELSPHWLSRNVSVVSQEPTLYARSVRRNIIYGLEGTSHEPSLEDIKEAARLANASSFIESLPDGYETDVGERGVQLSGGQKQRVAIARALVRKPRILLLDEATSALDSESEASVQEAIDDMLHRGKNGDISTTLPMTVFVVAHRLSTVRNADLIYVIVDGRIAETGPHDELVKDPNGAYSKLISRQVQAQQKLDI